MHFKSFFVSMGSQLRDCKMIFILSLDFDLEVIHSALFCAFWIQSTTVLNGSPKRFECNNLNDRFSSILVNQFSNTTP